MRSQFDLYVVFMFVLYYIFLFNTTTILSISITCVNSMDASYIPIAKALT